MVFLGTTLVIWLLIQMTPIVSTLQWTLLVYAKVWNLSMVSSLQLMVEKHGLQLIPHYWKTLLRDS